MPKYTKLRLMTLQEAKQECKALKLERDLTAYIVSQFEEYADAPSELEGCHGPYVAEDGKIGWGQSWEGAAEDLAEAMGKERDAGLYGEDPEFEVVWNKFFTE